MDYNTKFLMTKSKRANSGKYVIKAKNEVGEDEAEVEIIIVGKCFDLKYFGNNKNKGIVTPKGNRCQMCKRPRVQKKNCLKKYEKILSTTNMLF